ncbi:localization factor PodJL [Microdochium nivale]|nr:localization factor PodJL [Microdochium nivale]
MTSHQPLQTMPAASISPPPPPPLPSHSSNIDESRLPRGQCRYILLNPEIRGQRCACIGFTLNHDHPGVVCQCGHQSCYHVKDLDPHPGAIETDHLRQRVRALEQQLDREYQGGLGRDLAVIVKRLGDLEEVVEKNKEEAAADIKGCYRNVSRTWQSVDQVIRRQKLQDSFLDERLDDHADNLSRLDDKFQELNEVSITIEERLDTLENGDVDTEDSVETALQVVSRHDRRVSPQPYLVRPASRTLTIMQSHEPEKKSVCTSNNIPSIPRDPMAETRDWTVHVSLLPSMSQPFPFEKDTRAYKRCLSRGLHKMIAVSGRSSDAFVSAVSTSFGQLLKGRSWAPLHARLCDTRPLAGLPMLRPLDPSSIRPDNYTYDFLLEYCAVLPTDGKIDSLYIAMQHDVLSWEQLRASPVFLKGLASSWDHDPRLDRQDFARNDSPVTVEARACLPQNAGKKRQAAEISQEPETRCPSSGPMMARTARSSTVATKTDAATTTAVAAHAAESCDNGEAYLRPSKVPRTVTYDLPVSIKVQSRGEATALA